MPQQKRTHNHNVMNTELTRNQRNTQIAAVNAVDFETLKMMFLSEQDVRESSRKLYSRTLAQFGKWMEDEGLSLTSVTTADVIRYKEFLMVTHAPLTVGSYVVVVRKLFQWLEVRTNGVFRDCTKLVKLPKRKQAFKKQHLTERKCREFLNYFEGERTSETRETPISTPEQLRDVAMVNLMIRTGLRTIEVSRANVGDIVFKGERRVLKVWGKGRDKDDKDNDFVILSDRVWIPIQNYLNVARRNRKDSEPLFTSTASNAKIGEPKRRHGEVVVDMNGNPVIEDGRLTTTTISKICKGGLKKIGLDGREYTAHSLRHTTGVQILKHGGTITDVQDVLRHNSPVTSQIYVESIKNEMRLERNIESCLDYAF